ncbi:hypothetical protein [Romboutsia ilealis]
MDSMQNYIIANLKKLVKNKLSFLINKLIENDNSTLKIKRLISG